MLAMRKEVPIVSPLPIVSECQCWRWDMDPVKYKAVTLDLCFPGYSYLVDHGASSIVDFPQTPPRIPRKCSCSPRSRLIGDNGP